MIFSEAAELVETHNSDLTETTQRDLVAVLLAGYGEVESFRELSLYKQAATKYIASQFLPIPQWLYPIAGRTAIPNSERVCDISAICRNIKNYKRLLV
jgi:hypothetical protein